MDAPERPDPAIRRGRGLRLSTAGAAPPEPPAPPPEPAAGAAPIARGRGLRLTTHSPEPDQAPPLQARARVPAGLISYRRAGAGPPLLLIHGFGASGRIWRGAMRALAGDRACYAPDLPGSGDTPARPAAPTLEALADEVVAFADALGLERFALAGHSLGAAVAACVAGRPGARVERLVLTSLGVRRFAPELAALSLARPPLDLSLSLARPLLELWAPWASLAWRSPPAALLAGAQLLHSPPADPQLWEDLLADHARADGRAALTAAAARGDAGLQARMRAIAAPTLVVAGREDQVARLPDALTAHGLIPGARLAVIDACGHLPMVERPAEYHAALRAFLLE